ncbi:metalloregulator ArsR/SmtB family transcription factor [Pedobacter nutrimenti]|uniref:helix-turn-helix transcriptional regulator n=1 Tax=Pedobacter nutrimenti TaxID=1241337 RepID=UPI00292EE0E3|nr:metalloregulator ArsR/SmtB family transcription factor [Pedobacter nutrimenti]
MKTNKFLMLLKTRGALTAAEIAKELGMTSEGARLQLLKLTEEGLIQSQHESRGVGRPTQFFTLTAMGNAGFPDTHAELTVKLIQLIKQNLGEEALQSVINANEISGKEKYQRELESLSDLETRIGRLAEIRTREGYMAEYSKDEEGYLLIENHCPICAAAQVCQGFCSSELNTFKFVLGNTVDISRVNHIIAGDRRCAYRITLKKAS